MPTTNPVPSTDPTDLLFNAGKLDEVVSGASTYYTDRLGANRRTIEGINASADVVLAGLGYAPPVIYAAGISLTLATQTVEYSGEVYAPKVADLPFTTSGTFETAKFRLIQGVAYADLPTLVGQDLQDYAALRSYTGSATRIYITGQLVTSKPVGIAGVFQYDPTDTTSANNSGTVIVGSDDRRWKRDYSGAVNVKWFQALGIDSGNDAVAIKTARDAAGVGGEVFFPKGVYPVYEQLTQLQSQKWICEGGQRAVTIKKMFNGDLFIPAAFCTVEGINFYANGASYTGRGIYVASGFSIRLERVRVDQSQGVSLEFADGVGGGSHISDFDGSTTNPSVVPVIKIQDTSGPAPKFFDGIWLSGGLFDFSGGGNGSSLTNFYIRNFVTSAPNYPAFTGASGLFHISNGRVATIADTTIFSGADVNISNVAFSGSVYLDKAQGYKFASCTYGAGISENKATCKYNEFSDQAKTFATVWSSNSGAQPSIGNGTLTMWYTRTGYTCHVFLRLVIGSTTVLGDSTWRFTLPFRGHVSINQRGFTAHIFDPSLVGAAKDIVVSGEIGGNGDTMTFGSQGQGVRPGMPISWGVGSQLDASFTYMVA